MNETTIALGLVNWLVTTIMVESELTRPVRSYVQGKRDVNEMRAILRLPRKYSPVWHKLAYLVGCHLCTGTWVGLALVVVTPYRPLGGGLVGVLLAGLLYKAVGHLILVLVNYCNKKR